ncbi:cordon-bleu protein-like 1b isoform X3 [Antennarius striatus]|uniref:cordon-bleu protein-like 1b isoform X3 n=1 Tax=Antennarius striatus TaxID=241820 RepID=UPI0035B2DF43
MTVRLMTSCGIRPYFCVCQFASLANSPGDFVKPMSLVTDDRGFLPHPCSSGLRESTKSKAPSPPGLKQLDSPGFSQWYPGNPHLTMDQKENLTDKDLSLVVVLPGGEEKITTVHGSKPLMDLLVALCAKYHLNPSSHTLELVTANSKNTKLKPNALIGSVDPERIILKPKGEDKNKKTGPQMPEATVRMVINYNRTQKTILRVNPRVPLAELLPAVCEKCEFDVESTVLLRDIQSLAPLDLSCSLNDYAIREVYARDSKRRPASPASPVSPTYAVAIFPGKNKNQKEEENKGLFSKFRRSRKKSDQAVTSSAPASPVLVSKPRPLSMALPSSDSSLFGSPSISTDVPKKRRAPLPPVLVSQKCPLDVGTRRRLLSEPITQLDKDQIAGLSRGSSAESSLKRVKRKAPPPPKFPIPVFQETVPADENLQAGATANTLEEIMEQEESTVSVMSATASDTQGEDSSLGLSADVSLHSPSPHTDKVNTVEGNGEDHSCDLSSDGKQLSSALKAPATRSDVSATDVTVSSEGGITDVRPSELEKGLTPESIKEDGGTVPSSPPPTEMQSNEVKASVETNTETICEHTSGLVSTVTTSTPHPTAEDAQVQTDDMSLPLPPPPPPPPSPPPSPPGANTFETAGKKDMATLTDDLDIPDLKHAFSHNSETSCPDSTPTAPATAKEPCIYSTNSEPKPKPSNELTRDYIPKVGMTTYTIVPQKSLEKLRYFEVALTLESPHAVKETGLDIGSLGLEESAAQRQQTEASKERSQLHSFVPRKDLLTRAITTTHTVNGSAPQSLHSSSPMSPKVDVKNSSSVVGTSQARSATEVKEVKIPPATKPKPGSFRLTQHKKTPGYYVTSAAEKSLSVSPTSGQRETQENTRKNQLPSFPFPPPVQDDSEAVHAELRPKGGDKNVGSMRITRQSSLPAKEPTLGLSLEKLRSFAAPRPFVPVTPSRFAQAVSSAVKRSQSLSHRPKSPHSPSSQPLSPITAEESKELSRLKDSENRAVDGGSSLQTVEGEAPSFSGVLIKGESTP